MKPLASFVFFSILAISVSSLRADIIHDDDWTVGPSGTVVQAPITGDTYKVGSNFFNQSTQNTSWDTTLSTLEFYNAIGNPDGDPPYGPNTSGNHSLTYTGADLGNADYTGYADNFSWNKVIVDTGNQLLTSGGGALYTRELVLGGGLSQINSFTGNMIIYYDSANPNNAYLYSDYLAFGNHPFGSGGGFVAPVPIPEPGTILFGLVAGAIAVRSGFSWHRSRNRK